MLKNYTLLPTVLMFLMLLQPHFAFGSWEDDAPAEPGSSLADAAPRDQVATLLRVPPEELAKIAPTGPLTEPETIEMLRIMFLLQETPQAEAVLGADAVPYLDLLSGLYEGHAGQINQWSIVQLRGCIVQIEKLQSPNLPEDSPESVLTDMIPDYYRCKMRLAEYPGMPGDVMEPMSQDTAIIYLPEIPDAWLSALQASGESVVQDVQMGSTTNYFSVGCDAICIKTDDAAEARLEFISPHLAWRPEQGDYGLLGRLGMDVSLLDQVYVQPVGAGAPKVDLAKMKLTADDRLPFYAMLEAAGNAKSGELNREARKQLAETHQEAYSVVPLFNHPETQQGRLVELSGTVRRALLIRVDDTEIQQRYGVDHYYQFYMVTDDSQDNPVVFCTRYLPEGMPLGDGPNYAEAVTIAGFFFKTWAFKTKQPDEQGELQTRWQMAPLLIGREPVWHKPVEKSATDPLVTITVAMVLLLLLVLVWGWFKRRSRQQEDLTRLVRDRWIEPPKNGPSEDTNSLPRDVPPKP